MTTLFSKFSPFLVVTCLVVFAPNQGFAQKISSDCSLQELTKAARGAEFYKGAHYPQYLLGRRYYEGSGGAPRDAEAAVKWFISSVNNGGVGALMHLSACYKDGDGVAKDVDYSNSLSGRYLDYLREEGGDREGTHHFELGKVYYHRGTIGSPDHLKQAVQEFEMSRTAGNTDSLMFLVACYLDGTGVAISKDKAKEMFYSYLERRYPDVLSRVNENDSQAKAEMKTIFNSELGRLYYDHGCSHWEEGRKKAVQYLSAAAASKDESSLSLLANCYRNGFGVEKNESKEASLHQEWREAFDARVNGKKLSAKQKCDAFLAAETQVSIAEIRSAVDRWRMIDRLIEFQMPGLEDRVELSDERIRSIEEDAKLYLTSIRELEESKQIIERASLFGGKLTEQGIRQKIDLESKCSAIKDRIAFALEEIPNNELRKRISVETGISPRSKRVAIAMNSHGVYSYEHVSALVYEARKNDLAAGKTGGTSFFSSILDLIKSDGYNRVLANDVSTLSYDDDSERLLTAGLLMLEVSRLFDDDKKHTPTDSEKAKLKKLLSGYEYLLGRIADEYTANSEKGTKRMKDTRSAFAYSWNACQALIDSQ